jgi:hypothetical protein
MGLDEILYCGFALKVVREYNLVVIGPLELLLYTKLLSILLYFSKVKVNLSLCLTEHHSMKAYWGVEV